MRARRESGHGRTFRQRRGGAGRAGRGTAARRARRRFSGREGRGGGGRQAPPGGGRWWRAGMPRHGLGHRAPGRAGMPHQHNGRQQQGEASKDSFLTNWGRTWERSLRCRCADDTSCNGVARWPGCPFVERSSGSSSRMPTRVVRTEPVGFVVHLGSVGSRKAVLDTQLEAGRAEVA
jgi:hypothetical protein